MHQTTNPPLPDQAASSRTAARHRALMASRRLTRSDLAVALGIGAQSAGRRLNGTHDFRLDELEDIAAWLRVPLSELVPTG